MTNWMSAELDKVGAAEELQIAGLRANDTLKKMVTIWVVRVGSEIYIRSYKGRGSGWFKGVLVRHIGKIEAGGVKKDVAFVEVNDPTVQQQIDAAYRLKYRRQEKEYVDSVLTPEALAATLKLVPR
jgi:hypothetical protein